MKNHQLPLILLLGGVLLLGRLFPHPANFTPYLAICLFIGHRFRDNRFAMVLPILALFLSDMMLGFYDGWFFVYASLAAATVVGRQIRPKTLSVLGGVLSSSVIFFIVSNFGVWYQTTLYEKSLSGLTACYVAALPFFDRTLISTGLYSALIFGLSFVVLRSFVNSKVIEK